MIKPMKKPKKHKKKKKEKFKRQCGDFLFKNCHQMGNYFLIDCFFKEELIGELHCSKMKSGRVQSVGINVFSICYKIDNNLHMLGFDSKIFGEATCSTLSHGLPKKIISVSLSSKNPLISSRKVLIEKHTKGMIFNNNK